MSDLVVIVYPTEARAEEMRQKLIGLQKEYLIEIGDAAIAVMHEGGKVKLNAQIRYDPYFLSAFQSMMGVSETKVLDFSAQADKLLDGDRNDLEIEISVLRERLMREGVRPAPEPVDTDDTRTRMLRSEDARKFDELISSDRNAAKSRR